MNQPLSITFLRRALIALVVLGFSPVLIPLVHAQSNPAASDTNTPAAAPATPAPAPAPAPALSLIHISEPTRPY